LIEQLKNNYLFFRILDKKKQSRQNDEEPVIEQSKETHLFIFSGIHSIICTKKIGHKFWKKENGIKL